MQIDFSASGQIAQTVIIIVLAFVSAASSRWRLDPWAKMWISIAVGASFYAMIAYALSGAAVVTLKDLSGWLVSGVISALAGSGLASFVKQDRSIPKAQPAPEPENLPTERYGTNP